METKEKVEPTQETKVLETENKDNGFSSLPEETQKEIKNLREENAKRRVGNKEEKDELIRLRELETNVKEQKEKKLEEEGKIKELLEIKDKELEALKPIKDLNIKYEETFKKQLEEELKGLSDNMVAMVNGAGQNYAEKLAYAKTVKSEMSVSKNSPGFEAPGTSYTGGDHKIAINEIRNEKDMIKKAEMLFQLKNKNKQIYNQI